MYLTKTPIFIQNMFPSLIWNIKETEDKKLYITFDDGPIPEVTPWVLSELNKFNAKASFFCVGENVESHPEIVQQTLAAGHTIGNHSYNHLNGWTTSDLTYLRNVRQCDDLVQSNLFRPPYGRIKKKQALYLQRNYKIVMWDVLTGDFDPELSKEKCLENTIDKTSNGSIIVFHDSMKAKEKLKFVLPRFLAHFDAKGYSFDNLSALTANRELVKRA